MELATVENTNIIAGLDSRAELQALFNIKYFLTKNANSDIPYGFDEIEKTKTGKVLFVNKNELPFGYTYNSCVEESKLTELSGIDRSWICMDTAVVSSNNIPEVEYKKDIEGSLKNIEISVERQSDMTKVSFDNINNSEVYVKLYGNFDKLHTDEIIIGDKTKFIKFENLNSKWYIDREYMFYHIGYFESISEFLITGNYEYDKIEVYYHLIDDYTDKINKLSKYHLENVVFDSNRISGNIEVPESRLLCITVPKINGWKAYIDGREANIIKINGMFIGLHIHPGRHNVELEFRPPGLYIGFILHSVSVLIIIANLMVTKYTRSGIDGKNHRTGRNTSKA